MSIRDKMLASYGKWCGAIDPVNTDRSGRVYSVAPACQIIRNSTDPFVGAAGDKPWLWCMASENYSGARRWRPGIAGYVPFKCFNFEMHAEPGATGGAIQYGDGALTESEIHYAAELIEASHAGAWKNNPWQWQGTGPFSTLKTWFVRDSQPHCERLNFISGADTTYKTGWAKPGGNQSSTPPVQQNYSLWRRVPGANICMSLIQKRGSDYYSKMNQDFRTSTLTPTGDGSGEVEVAPTVANPGFFNPFADAEVWGSWVPSRIAPWGATVPATIGESVELTDYDEYYTVNASGNVVYDHTDYGTTHTYNTGEYDWRFLNCFIQKTHWDRSGGYHIRHVTYPGPMYWDLDANELAPAGITDIIDFIADQITPRAHTAGIGANTKFDIKIHAVVHAMRVSPQMAADLAADGWTVNALSTSTYSVRVWSHTNFYVSVRQVMPLPIL